MEKTGYVFLALSLLLELGKTCTGFSVDARPAVWSAPMNLSGNSAAPVFEVSAEQDEKPSPDIATPLNLSGGPVRQQRNVPTDSSANYVEYLSEGLVEFCQDVPSPLNLSGNSMRQQWSVPMNFSGNWTLSLFEIFEELSSDVDSPLNLSGNTLRKHWSVPMNLSGNSARSRLQVLKEFCQDVRSPLNLSGNSVRQEWRVPMNLSIDSTESHGVFAKFSEDVPSPLNLSRDSEKNHFGGSITDNSVSKTQDSEKLNPELLPGFDLFNKMSRDGILAQCVNDVIPNPPVIVNQIIAVDTQVTFKLEDIDPLKQHQRYKCYFLLQDNYPRHVSAVVWTDETHRVSSFNCVHCDYQIYIDGLYIFFKGQLIKIQDWQPF